MNSILVSSNSDIQCKCWMNYITVILINWWFRLELIGWIVFRLQSDAQVGFLRCARDGKLDKILEHLKNNTDINTTNLVSLDHLDLCNSISNNISFSSLLLSILNSIDCWTIKYSIGSSINWLEYCWWVK